MTLRPFDVTEPDELLSAFAIMKREAVDAVSVEAALGVYRKRIVELAAKSRLPAFYRNTLFVDDGGLIGSSVDWLEIFWKAGRYAGQILNGAKPADLPVEPKRWGSRSRRRYCSAQPGSSNSRHPRLFIVR